MLVLKLLIGNSAANRRQEEYKIFHNKFFDIIKRLISNLKKQSSDIVQLEDHKRKEIEKQKLEMINSNLELLEIGKSNFDKVHEENKNEDMAEYEKLLHSIQNKSSDDNRS